MTMEQPLLLPKLKSAISSLYSNNTDPNQQQEAHEFLLRFKSINVRRLVTSRLQSQKDKVKVVGEQNNSGTLDHLIGGQYDGSIFLSCLSLILQEGRHSFQSHERIFASQVLNHRIRMVKIVEALDVELEDGVECGLARLVLASEDLRLERLRVGDAAPADTAHVLDTKSRVMMTAWLDRYVPMIARRCGCYGSSMIGLNGGKLLSLVLERHATTLLAYTSSPNEDQREEQIKGTLMMLTFAVAIYVSAFYEYEEECHLLKQRQEQEQELQHPAKVPWANSVLSDLSSALSVTALRLRYRPLEDKCGTPQPESTCPPLIEMLVDAMNVVKDSANTIHQQQSHQPSIYQAHRYASKRSIAAVLTHLPETLLLPVGQDNIGYRVPSVDRACLRAASMELRTVGSSINKHVGTGMDKAWQILVESERHHGSFSDDSAVRLLECCGSWSRFVAVPLDIIGTSVGTIVMRYLLSAQQQQQKAREASYRYLTSIFESAAPALTSGDLLTAALGVGASGHTGGGSSAKKKQGNRSKKRREKRLGRAVAVQDCQGGDDGTAAADKELIDRRNAACFSAAAVFGISLPDGVVAGDAGLQLAAMNPATSTHEICSTVSAAAISVLPHLLFLERREGEVVWRIELFTAIMVAMGRMCTSSIRSIRALAYEPLMVLHASNSVASVTLKMEQVAIDCTCECTLALAASCAYPVGYFDCLHDDNDGELESERNDVRDVARSVCGLETECSGVQKSPPILVLERIVTACSTTIQNAASSGQLPPEAVVHILSALAKPLNKLGKMHCEQRSNTACTLLTTALLSLEMVCNQLNFSFDTHSVSQLFPSSRLTLLAIASLSPLLSYIAKTATDPVPNAVEREMIVVFRRALLSYLHHALMSTGRIPELNVQSIPKTRYDIRGAMTGPGGDDHVGCIALLRLTHESDCLTRAILEIYGHTFVEDLASLYQSLKKYELERGVGIEHGRGVTPFSRRVVLRVISRLALSSKSGTSEEPSNITVLHHLVEVPLQEIRSQKGQPFSAETLYRVCEASMDLSFFSPEIIANMLNNNISDSVGIIAEYVTFGYSSHLNPFDDFLWKQWARLRGSAYALLLTCIKANITQHSASLISALVNSEIDAAVMQCNHGPDKGSNIFSDSVVGDEMANAGVYIMLVKECLDRLNKGQAGVDKCIEEYRICLAVLKDVAPAVLKLIMHQSPEASSHVDPRPSTAEAWYLTMATLVSSCQADETIAASLVADGVEPFIGDSLSVYIALVLMKDYGANRARVQKGMSLDGPQTVSMLTFIGECLLFPSILSAGGRSILSMIQINDVYGESNVGAVIFAASLLRAFSGALPPWSIEEAPALIKSMYVALGNDPDRLVQILGAGSKVTLANNTFGAVKEGELIAGPYLKVSDSHIESFLHQTKDVCRKGTWSKLKVVLKSTCGGKKKDSGFNQKPQLTSWECGRL